jgi:uncharacterized protein (TIGR02996 family)
VNRRDQIEAVIDEEPERDDGYLVLADLLTEAGDPRGELIVLQHEAAKHRGWREIALLKELAPPHAPGFHECAWKCGYVRSARLWIGDDERDALVAFLAHPSVRFLTELEIALRGRPGDDTEWAIPAIAAAPCRASLRRLDVKQTRVNGNRPPRDRLDLMPLASLGLARLDATARELVLPPSGGRRLESLTLDGELGGAALAQLVAATPTLRQLKALDLSTQAPFWQELARACTLTDLHIEGQTLDAASVAAILAAPSPLGGIATPRFPHASPETRAAISGHLGTAGFAAPRDPDRYAQTGE